MGKFIEVHKDKKDFLNFWRCINICHDVLMIETKATKQLSGASQDELILLETAGATGFAKFINRDSDSVIIELNGQEEHY